MPCKRKEARAMADMTRGTAAAPARSAQTEAELENLPVLIGRLGDEVMQLVDTKINLLKVEVKEEVSFFTRVGAMIGTGAAVAAIGFALLNIAVAFFVSLLFSYSPAVNYALGFVITGVVYMIIGGIVVKTMK